MWSPSQNFVGQYFRSIFATKAHIDNWKNVLNSNVSPTCPHNIVNFGPLAAEIRWRVWSTPTNFNGFRVLAALLHDTVVVGVKKTLRRWTEGATYSAVRPSRWALAHIQLQNIELGYCCEVLNNLQIKLAVIDWWIFFNEFSYNE